MTNTQFRSELSEARVKAFYKWLRDAGPLPGSWARLEFVVEYDDGNLLHGVLSHPIPQPSRSRRFLSRLRDVFSGGRK